MDKLSEELKYLTSDSVGKIIYEGLASVYEAQPEHPVRFLADWLLNYCKNQNNHQKELETEIVREQLVAKYNTELENNFKALEQEEKVKEATAKVQSQFKEYIENHLYHEELLPGEFPDFIKQTIGVSSAYAGFLGYPLKEIDDDDEDINAHLDMTQEKLIRYIGASKEQKFIIGKQLLPETGVTYDVLKPKEEEEPVAEEGEEEGVPRPPKPTYLYVSDVTKEPRMVYFRIPRLGAFITNSLSYKSVLIEQAFDEGVKERIQVLAEKERVQKEREEKEAEYQQKLEDAQDEGIDTREMEEEWKNTVWEEVNEKPFESEQRDYVLCADTLGEDREILEDERAHFEDLAKFFVRCWEAAENKELSKDIDLQLKYLKEFNKEEYLEDFATKVEEEVDERVNENEELDEGEPSEAKVDYKKAAARSETYKRILLEDDIRGYLMNLKDYRLVKFMGVIQTALILIGFTKQEINIPKTNILNWKKMRSYIGEQEFYDKLAAYQYKGPKTEAGKSYARPARILKRLEGYTMEEIDDYNIGLGILYRYLKQVSDARIMDVQVRKQDKADRRVKRQQLIEQENERQQKKAEAMEEAREQRKKEIEEQKELEAEEAAARAAEEAEEEEEEGEAEEKPQEESKEAVEGEEGEGAEAVEGEGEGQTPEEIAEAKERAEWEAWEAEFAKTYDEENPPIEIPPEVEEDIDEDMEPEVDATE